MILIFPLLLIFVKHLKSLIPSKAPLPPGPKPLPIIGNLLQIGKDPHVKLSEFARSYGPLISLRLGTQILIVGSSLRAAEEILKTNDRLLSGRQVPHAVPARRPEFNYLSLAWAFDCNDQWKFLRLICKTELFSVKSMESQARLREKKVCEMVEYIYSMEGKVMELGNVVSAAIFNTMTNILMSRDLTGYGEDGGIKVLVTRFLEEISAHNLSDFYPIFGGLDLQGLNKKAKEVMGKIYALWEPTIKERRENKRLSDITSQHDFLDVLLHHAFTDDQINYLFLELISAAIETSASTIEWIVAELIKNPEYMTRAQDELAKEINKDSPRESHLNQLPYLQACVKETLRLHPPAPLMLPHRALESCKMMDYTIPKNAQVLVNVWALGRDPKSWEEPLAFKPDRFLNSGLDFKGKDFEFIPFGAGRRICPGLPMAIKHVSLIVASLIHFFEWSFPHGKDPTELDMAEKYILTIRKEQPLVLIPAARKKQK